MFSPLFSIQVFFPSDICISVTVLAVIRWGVSVQSCEVQMYQSAEIGDTFLTGATKRTGYSSADWDTCCKQLASPLNGYALFKSLWLAFAWSQFCHSVTRLDATEIMSAFVPSKIW
jgi:uncharacterized membrane protein YoaK (UPF0700 family)